ncbi:DUF459 domain-containing protein [Neisseria shayeganii]|uniref:DUF459 domain-containing protein n=2 Tax=Neisseria shayeganii TaxID=607712 RepID=A0A7D7NFM6_9NEIS|nr:DUF459 domain-containing protein [Neisseria shayeganii]
MKPHQAKRKANRHKYSKSAPRPAAPAPVAVRAAAQADKHVPELPAKPHIPVRQPKPQPPAALAEKPQPRRYAWGLAAVMLCTALLTVWFSQQSINAYWQQTYHRASPLEMLNRYAWWQSGARLQTAANERYQALADWFAGHNERWRPPPAPAAKPGVQVALAHAVPLEQANVKPPSETVKPLAAEQRAPDKVRLTAGDKVFFAGDSMMEGIAPHLQRRLRSEYGIQSVNLSRQSTGLSYPQFFDWPAVIEKQLQDDPDIKLLVVFLGPNDPWDFPNPQQPGSGYLKFQSPEWEQVYRQRIDRIVQAARRADVQLVWLGIPLMKGSKLNTQMRYLDGIMASELQGKAIWLPTDRLLGGSENGEYRDSIELDGRSVRVRSKDGIHFTLKGQQFLADHLAAYIEYRAPEPVAAAAVPAAVPHTP